MPTVTVEAGDCIASIAAAHGHLAATLWDHGQNAALKALRKDPMVLHAGDQVFVPDQEEKSLDAAAGQSHRYVCKAVPPTFLNLRFVDFLGDPRAGVPYVIDIDGVLRGERCTDGGGYVREPISPTARKARILFTGDDDYSEEWYEVDLGHLAPFDTLAGVRQRLRNLNFLHGSEDDDGGELDDLTRRALKRFQKACELPATGDNDGATQAKLLELHGC